MKSLINAVREKILGRGGHTAHAHIRHRRQRGSTIIAVLASMLFIGIVTASMLKNTSSQSRATRSYSGMQVMSSTVRSGMIATESYFSNLDSASDLSLLESASKDITPIPFKEGLGKNRIKLAANQFFSSRIIKIGEGANPVATFEINAGKKENGKAGKTALAFYRMGNVTIDPPKNPLPSEHALYSASAQGHLKAGLNVPNGRVTFNGPVEELQRKMSFGGDVYFGGEVNLMGYNHDFNGKTYFDKKVTMAQPPNDTMFKNSVGFNKGFYSSSDAVLNVAGDFIIGGYPEFQQPNAKINGSVTSKFFYTDSLPILTSDNPGMPAVHEDNDCPTCGKRVSQSMPDYTVVKLPRNIKIPDEVPNGCIHCPILPCSGADCYYSNVSSNNQTDELRIKTGWWNFNNVVTFAACPLPHKHNKCCQFNDIYGNIQHPNCKWACENKCDQWGNNCSFQITCRTHPDGHVRVSDNNTFKADQWGNVLPNRVSGYSDPSGRERIAAGQSAVLNKLGMDPPNEEPQLDISRIKPPTNIYSMATLTSNNQKFNTDKLISLYEEAKTADALFDGHLVIKIGPGVQKLDMGGGTFNEKVIFIVEDGGKLETDDFYTSGPSASTLIYAGAGNAVIDKFKTKDNGDFRGLIYVAPGNTGEHFIKLGDGGNVNIYGAIHNFSTQAKFNWEGGGQTIHFDRCALGAFSKLSTLLCPNYPNCPNSGEAAGADIVCPSGATYINPDSTDVTAIDRVKLTPLGYYFY